MAFEREDRMKTYPVDLDARQIVLWLIEEKRRGVLGFRPVATRSYVSEEVTDSGSQRLNEDAGDLNGVFALGLLEITPPGGHGGWTLRIRVEDRLGPRLPDEGDAPEGEQEIDLAAFAAEFILPERGTAEVELDAADAHAKASFSRLFKQMLTDKHRPVAR
jgi:hypothetical protein